MLMFFVLDWVFFCKVVRIFIFGNVWVQWSRMKYTFAPTGNSNFALNGCFMHTRSHIYIHVCKCDRIATNTSYNFLKHCTILINDP